MPYKPIKTSVLDKARFSLYQQGIRGCPEKRAVEHINSMLQRKKGRIYGGCHQKALQISARRLPPEGVSKGEGALFLPGLRYRPNACKFLLMRIFLLSIGRAFLSQYNRSTARLVMVYLTTRRLKYPLNGSSNGLDLVIGRSHR